MDVLKLPSTTDDIICDHLSAGDLARYAVVCHHTHTVVESYKKRAFDLHKILSRFFSPSETQCFRYWQARTGMLISGSTALQYFDRTRYAGSDLDIYVEHRYSDVIGRWFERIGYKFVPRPSQPDTFSKAIEQLLSYVLPPRPEGVIFFHSATMGYFGRGVGNVYNFFKTDPERKIQLITSYHSPLEIILSFHSTCVMNVISHEKAYALYPRATFEERRSLKISTEGSHQEIARMKYVERGWQMLERPCNEELCNISSLFQPGTRAIGDKYCWTMPLPLLQLPGMLQSTGGYVEINTWKLSYSALYLKPKMDFFILQSPLLQNTYLVAHTKLRNFFRPALEGDVEEKKLDEHLRMLLHGRNEHFDEIDFTDDRENSPPWLVHGRNERFAEVVFTNDWEYRPSTPTKIYTHLFMDEMNASTK